MTCRHPLVLSFIAMAGTSRVLTIPRRKMTIAELESYREIAFREVQKSERLRKIQIYGGMAALFILGMVAQYVLTHL